jgi:N-acyl-D-aspartate/D-glutamate deacylase
VLDLLIRDGQLIDGTGATRRNANIGIRDQRIVAVGEVDEPALRTISADGAIVAPGFIDPHTHYDVQLFWEPTLTTCSSQGVTTVIAGNCGFSIAPLTSDSADYLMSMLARVEGMPLELLKAGVPWDWQSSEDYFDRLEGRMGLNAGFMVGHSTMRRIVMGEAASQRQATPDELTSMKALLRSSLAAGGLGFSSSLAQAHLDGAGDPIPSRHASDNELLELAAVCGEYVGTSLEINPHTGVEFPDRVVDLMIAMSARARRPLNWNILTVRANNADEVQAKLAVSDQARRAGGKVVALVMPLPIGLRLNFISGFVLDMLPGWEKPMTLSVGEKMELLSSDRGRAHLRSSAEQARPKSHFANWANYEIYECFAPETMKYVGKRVDTIAPGRAQGAL